MPLNKPRVLWFTNTPSLADSLLNIPTIGGGWIRSLQEKMEEKGAIDLAVAFKHGEKELKKFSSEKSTYYAIPFQKKNKIKTLIGRHVINLENDVLLKYCEEIIEDFKPDIINVFGTEDGFGLIAKRIKIPVVIHLQGILTVYERKWHAANISSIELISHSGIKSFLLGGSLFNTYKYLKKTALREQEIFKVCKYFMGRTDWDRRLTSVLAPKSIYYRSEEILRKQFYSLSWEKRTEENKVFVSTIQANLYKGLETILESAALLTEVNLFTFKWYIAGIAGDSVIAKIFESKIGKRFKDYNVVFLGKLSAEEIVQLELKSDIFIHPSHIDNSPNSICEAMLLGMPIIATNAGGTSSLLNDKKEGLLIQDGDPYAMAGAIAELVKDPDYASELGRNARERGQRRNDPDAIAQNVFDIYSKILDKKLSSSAVAEV